MSSSDSRGALSGSYLTGSVASSGGYAYLDSSFPSEKIWGRDLCVAFVAGENAGSSFSIGSGLTSVFLRLFSSASLASYVATSKRLFPVFAPKLDRMEDRPVCRRISRAFSSRSSTTSSSSLHSLLSVQYDEPSD